MTARSAAAAGLPLVSALLGALLGAGVVRLLESPPEPARTPAARENAAVQRALDRLAAAARALADRTAAPRPDAPAGGTEPPSAAGPAADDPGANVREASALAVARARESAYLRSLIERPTDGDALRRLSLVSDHMTAQYALRAYADVLAEFGRPTHFGFNNGMISFHYRFEDAAGQSRSVSFVFHDGLVFRVSVR